MVERSDRENTRFQLGEIAGVVSTLPDRMDRFEKSVKEDLAEIKRSVFSQEKRITIIERAQWRISGVYGTIGAIIGAGLSGFLVKFWPPQ
jgi:hypothetical protein